MEIRFLYISFIGHINFINNCRMENLFKSWISRHLGMEEEENDDMIIMNNYSLNEEQEFLMKIFNGRPDFSSPESSEHYYYYSSPNNNNNNNNDPNNCDTSPNNNNSSVSFEDTRVQKSKSSNSIPSSTYLLSFEPNSFKGRSRSDDGFELFEASMSKNDEDATTKKRKGKTADHIIAERKRRQDLTRSIIQLSATIPGLKKMDKAHVIRESLSYIKVLQDRVKELENQIKDRRVDSAIFIGRSQDSSSTDKSTISYEITSDNNNGGGIYNELSLEIEAKVMEKEVLIRIQCEKQKNNIIMLKIHAFLDKLHLSIASNSVLPFGTSTLVIITIVAEMDNGGKFSMTMDELVKSLREDLMETNNNAW
ncbi:transcription factor NAI1 isoform X1 [Arachis ipaensis]|uniref:transcription factor NAI1 isoform X1 n=1 Tax=Arachis ipaensis TaxID=130454 RepID=UPI000A2B10BB|nr:transcription factor NAI1 isoform X1 [Arachis ipaensis]